MCDFEDIDLYQVCPIRHKDTDREWIEPIVYTDNSREETERSKEEEDVWFT